MKTAKLIILEGNISAGKTSLARDLARLLNLHVFFEPMITNPYLDRFYAEPGKYALVMQLWLLKQRFRTYLSAIKHVLETGRGGILDRSVFSDWVFAEKNKLDGNISEEGYREYLNERKQMLAHLPTPQITVFLDVPPQECYRRVHELRRRDCETGISLSYLAGLDECYKKFLVMMEKGGSSVISIPWTTFGDANQVAQIIEKRLEVVPPLHLLVDVQKLSDHVNHSPLVRSIMDSSYNERETSFVEENVNAKERTNNPISSSTA